MASTQLSFGLRVSSGVKTVHLLGSWDSYVGQLPLSKDKDKGKGHWRGTFRFSASTLEPGQRSWYYYIIDGYHVSHNPSEASTVEPTTGRQLNILDVPKSKSSSSSSASHSKSSSSKSSSRHSHHGGSSRSSKHRPPALDVAKGRPLSVSQIKAPKPMSPYGPQHILHSDYDYDELAEHFASTNLDEYDDDVITTFESNSPLSSGSDLSYRSDSSSPSSNLSGASGYSTPNSDCSSCTCERYGITRKGDRVRLDCGGKRCGFDETCSSSSDDDGRNSSSRSARRHGVVVR